VAGDKLFPPRLFDMTFLKLVFRSVTFHARSHLGALLGAAVGTAVLVGALVVGDSVRESLRQMALTRLGSVHFALASNDRLFRSALAYELGERLNGLHSERAGETPWRTAAVLQLPGTAATASGSARANQVQVLGVDESFWKLALQAPEFDSIPDNSVVINEALAEQLQVQPGETILLRLQQPSELSRDAPLSPEENFSVSMRVPVHAILSDAELGRFSLQANQIAPFNAFLSLAQMQRRVEAPHKANLLLAGTSGPATLEAEELKTMLREIWQVDDAQLQLLELPGGNGIELRTPRVFLDPPAAASALKIPAPEASAQEAGPPAAQGILTYLVNEIRSGERATPYSMVTGMGDPIVPAGMGDDEILVNSWLAEDLQVQPGDPVSLTYFVVGRMRQPEERSATFRVREILPLEYPAADPTLMPDFPGLTDAESCRDWDTGFPIEMDRIRDRDERYWDEYRGTPKAFVTLRAGQRMWGNRFGEMTAIRFAPGMSLDHIAREMRTSLDPETVGLVFEPVRSLAVAASEQSQDFGGLFIGFSFFLIVAALLLMGLLFQFGVEQRTSEIGTLLALGWTPKQVRRLLLSEGSMVALAGGLAGLAGGVYYARGMLYGLSTIWRDAVGTSALQYHATVPTLLIGTVAGIAVALLTIWIAVRKQARQPARELLAAGTEEYGSRQEDKPGRSRAFWVGWGAAGLSLALVGVALARGESAAAGLFFGAGAGLLVAGIAFSSVLLRSLRGSQTAAQISLAGMGVRNATRRRRRSLAILGLLSCGSFLIASIGVFRLDALQDAEQRSSGTGGFALLGESTLPLVHDLNSQSGRETLGLDAPGLAGVDVVPFRVRDGEDASCLNLNRAQRPRLLGVEPELLNQREAFTFTRVLKGLPREQPWLLLDDRPDPDIIPAIGDAASIQWALGKSVGDTLEFTDERGRPFQIRIVGAVANSILQGNLLISEEAFVSRFPSESGYRLFLIDLPAERMETVSATFSRALQDYGMELTPTTRRLAAYNAVQNTYLSTFQVLGGLGLLLGSAGLGVVVLRNVLERKGELGLLLAVGFRSRALKWLVVSEHGALLVLGLGLGIVAAGVAVLPALLTPGAELPWVSLVLTLGAVFLSGAVWTWLAAWVALRGKLLEALRGL
jgi:putative ABC transport system permease protein